MGETCLCGYLQDTEESAVKCFLVWCQTRWSLCSSYRAECGASYFPSCFSDGWSQAFSCLELKPEILTGNITKGKFRFLFLSPEAVVGLSKWKDLILFHPYPIKLFLVVRIRIMLATHTHTCRYEETHQLSASHTHTHTHTHKQAQGGTPIVNGWKEQAQNPRSESRTVRQKFAIPLPCLSLVTIFFCPGKSTLPTCSLWSRSTCCTIWRNPLPTCAFLSLSCRSDSKDRNLFLHPLHKYLEKPSLSWAGIWASLLSSWDICFDRLAFWHWTKLRSGCLEQILHTMYHNHLHMDTNKRNLMLIYYCVG